MVCYTVLTCCYTTRLLHIFIASQSLRSVRQPFLQRVETTAPAYHHHHHHLDKKAVRRQPVMALIQTSLIWVTYAVAIAILLVIASIFVYVYQAPRERSAAVTIVCIFTVLSLLATVLLMPVDIALVSSTTDIKLGTKKDWATPDAVDNIKYQLEIVYYTLYSLDALLCLVVVPFTYFWYEEYDEVDSEEGNQTFGSRFWGAFKYTIAFVLLVVILFLVGFFVPVAKEGKKHRDLDFFKDLLTENRKTHGILS